jgi:hypothetical protein
MFLINTYMSLQPYPFYWLQRQLLSNITGIVCHYRLTPPTKERESKFRTITFSNSPLSIGSNTSAAQRDQKPTVMGRRVAWPLSARHGVQGEEEVGDDRLEEQIAEEAKEG